MVGVRERRRRLQPADVTLSGCGAEILLMRADEPATARRWISGYMEACGMAEALPILRGLDPPPSPVHLWSVPSSWRDTLSPFICIDETPIKCSVRSRTTGTT